MILLCGVSLTELEKIQKDYPWEKPKSCPKCNSGLWGHGFVLRYFNACLNGIFVKRWRCPHCKLILTCRPNAYWRRCQETIANIFEALLFRIKQLKWPPWVSRQRGGYWLKKFISNANNNLLMKESISQTIYFYRDKKLVIFN